MSLGDNRQWSTFFLYSALITAVLLVDDLYTLHKSATRINWRFNELVVFGLYGAMLLYFLVRFRARIMKTDYVPLLLAFAFLGVSFATDQLVGNQGDTSYAILVEDGAKLLGIVSWLVYFARTCMQQVQSRLALREKTTPEL